MKIGKAYLLQFIHEGRQQQGRRRATTAEKWWLAVLIAGLVLFIACIVMMFVSYFNSFWYSAVLASLFGEIALLVAYIVWSCRNVAKRVKARAAAGTLEPPDEQDEARFVLICWALVLLPIAAAVSLFLVPPWNMAVIPSSIFFFAPICTALWLRLRRARRPQA